MYKNKEILLDSNVLVYSTNTLSSKYAVAREFRNSALKGAFIPIISEQNIMETIRILTHSKYENPMSISLAIKQVNSFRKFCKVICPLSGTVELALALIKKYKVSSNCVFDAYLSATMLINGVKTIATDNESALKIFKEINVLNPFKSLR